MQKALELHRQEQQAKLLEEAKKMEEGT
jgi:hypothetical protein